MNKMDIFCQLFLFNFLVQDFEDIFIGTEKVNLYSIQRKKFYFKSKFHYLK
jgi:hypothetical protein